MLGLLGEARKITGLGFICVYQVSESLPCGLCLCPNIRPPGDMLPRRLLTFLIISFFPELAATLPVPAQLARIIQLSVEPS